MSNGTTISLDADERPELRSSGIVASNYRGNWRTACAGEEPTEVLARIAGIVCSYLGFSDYYKFKVFSSDRLRNTTLQGFNNYSTYVEVKEKENCSLFYVKCSKEITHPKMEHYVIPGEHMEQQIYTPWIAMVHSDGIYQCTGILVDQFWVMTSAGCLQEMSQYAR